MFDYDYGRLFVLNFALTERLADGLRPEESHP